MKIDLKKYFSERDRINSSRMYPGPVVTFSRQYGCEANRLAMLLIKRINEIPIGTLKKHPWRYISKEILDESSVELGLKVHDVEQRIQSHSTAMVDNVFASLSNHYQVPGKQILEKVREIILTYARKGNVILIGRGGAAVTKGIGNALRIKLIASLDWRVKSIAGKTGLEWKEALSLVNHIDKNRVDWVEHLSGVKYDDSLFDLIINVERMSDKEIIDVILMVMQKRGMIVIPETGMKQEPTRPKTAMSAV